MSGAISRTALLRLRLKSALRGLREASFHPVGDERAALANLRRYLPDAPVALDIGANKGRWTRAFLELYPQATILMVEAQPELANALERLSSRHPNLTAISAVLAAEEAVRDFYVCRGDRHRSGSSLLPELTGAPLEQRKVTTSTLDDLIDPALRPRPVDVLKLDTQGSELEILLGATKTLEDVRFVQMEVSLVNYNDGAPLLAEVVAFMSDRGFFMADVFGLKYFRDTDDLMQVDCLFSREARSVTELARDR